MKEMNKKRRMKRVDHCRRDRRSKNRERKEAGEAKSVEETKVEDLNSDREKGRVNQEGEENKKERY